MRIILFILSVLFMFSGATSAATAQTVFQQLLGHVDILTAAVLFVGAAIVESNRIKGM